MKISTLLSQAIGAIALATVCVAASAAPINLVKNGGFELNTGNGQVNYNTTLTDWSSPGGYNFIFSPGTADTTGAPSWFPGNLALWGKGNGGENFLTDSSSGGYFFAADGAYGIQPITQMVSGLEVGKTYELSFEWAAAQQYGFDGATTEQWHISFGDSHANTGVYNLKSHGFSGWMQEAFVFTATATDQLLSFLAAGTPEGFPPFSLLDGVSLVEVSENQDIVLVPAPATWMTTIGGLAMLAAVLRRRRKAG